MSLEVTEQILGRFQDELKQVFTEQPELMRGGVDNLRLDLMLNECFVIQRRSLMAERGSVMS